MKVPYATQPEDLDVPDATPDAGSGHADLTVGLTFGPADLTALCRLDELWLKVTE